VFLRYATLGSRPAAGRPAPVAGGRSVWGVGAPLACRGVVGVARVLGGWGWWSRAVVGLADVRGISLYDYSEVGAISRACSPSGSLPARQSVTARTGATNTPQTHTRTHTYRVTSRSWPGPKLNSNVASCPISPSGVCISHDTV